MYNKLLEAIMTYYKIKYDKLDNAFYRVYYKNGDYTRLEINTESDNIVFEGRVMEEDALVEMFSRM